MCGVYGYRKSSLFKYSTRCVVTFSSDILQAHLTDVAAKMVGTTSIFLFLYRDTSSPLGAAPLGHIDLADRQAIWGREGPLDRSRSWGG